VKGYETGRACSKNGRDKKCIKYRSENPKGKDHLGGLGVDGQEILIGS
jgi:hypothetical protein